MQILLGRLLIKEEGINFEALLKIIADLATKNEIKK